MPSSRGSSQPRNQTIIFCIGRHALYHQRHLRIPKRGSSGPQDQCGTSVRCCWLSRLGLNLTKRIQISYCQLVCIQVYAALWGPKEDSSSRVLRRLPESIRLWWDEGLAPQKLGFLLFLCIFLEVFSKNFCNISASISSTRRNQRILMKCQNSPYNQQDNNTQ